MAEDHAFSLHDQATRRARQAAAESKVRAIKLGGELLQAPAPGTAAPAPKARPVDQAYLAANGVSAKVWGAIQQLLGEDGRSRLNLSELDVSKVSYSLEVRYEGRRTEAGGNALDRIGDALRNADGVATRVVLDNGDIIEGDELRVSGRVRIETRDGLPTPQVVQEMMRTWLLERIGAGDLE